MQVNLTWMGKFFLAVFPNVLREPLWRGAAYLCVLIRLNISRSSVYPGGRICVETCAIVQRIVHFTTEADVHTYNLPSVWKHIN